jgi:hypothetical protein
MAFSSAMTDGPMPYEADGVFTMTRSGRGGVEAA